MTKDKNRVSALYKEGTKDWQAQYDMLLDDGLTCDDCMHCADNGSCRGIYGGDAKNNRCQWYPNRFIKKTKIAR